jgi:hypothetical protein
MVNIPKRGVSELIALVSVKAIEIKETKWVINQRSPKEKLDHFEMFYTLPGF